MTDTGPPYPPGPLPGSNSIGMFTIGVSPIGDIPPFSPYKTVISQYSNSPRTDAILLSFAAAMDLTALLDSFYDNMMNPATATGYGLDVIGRIVGVSRTLTLPGSAPYLGFEEAGSSWTGFGQGGFYSGSGITSNFLLADVDYRRLIFAKMAGNISDCSIPSVNAILLALFPGRGKCYVADGLNMTLTYTFMFALTAVDLAIIQQAGILPNPCGVVINFSHP